MKKILLGTSAILGALTLLNSSAVAQNAAMMKDQTPSMKASVGGSISPVLQGYNGSPKIAIDLPAWRNYLSLKIDGTSSTLGLTYGAYMRYRPADGANGTDKAYAYMGYKYLGQISLGKDNSIIGNNFIDGSTIIPGYSQDGEGVANSMYNTDTLDITNTQKPLGVTYKTPTIYGINIGYTYSNGNMTTEDLGGTKVYANKPSTTAVGKIFATNDVNLRYDGAFGPVTLAVNAGARFGSGEANASNRDITAYTAGAQVGYSDGKNIGVQIAGGWALQNNSTTKDKATGWSVAAAFNTPRVAGLTLGVLFGAGEKTAGSDTSTIGTLLAGSGVTTAKNYHVGAGLGYAWSDNFSQTLSYDKALGGNAGAITNGYAWELASQLTF